MTPCARSTQPCKATPFNRSELRLDVEVLADHYEDLLALPPLEDDPPEDELEETDDAEDEASDDLPF